MPQYIDAYFLVPGRSAAAVKQFIRQYLPLSAEATDEYPVPLHTDEPAIVFDAAADLLAYLEQNTGTEYAVYWSNGDATALMHHFMVFYTGDGNMIFGVSTPGSDPAQAGSVQLFRELKAYLNADTGCITVEEPPPADTKEFFDFCAERYMPEG